MKCVIFKGETPFNLRGAWGCITIEGRGVINRVEKGAWAQAKKAYASVIEDYKTRGYLIESDTKDLKTFRDNDVNNDTMKEASASQGTSRNARLIDGSNEQTEVKSKERIGLEKKANELNIAFDDKTTSTELKKKIRELMVRGN